MILFQHSILSWTIFKQRFITQRKAKLKYQEIEVHGSPVPINSNINVGSSGKLFPFARLIALIWTSSSSSTLDTYKNCKLVRTTCSVKCNTPIIFSFMFPIGFHFNLTKFTKKKKKLKTRNFFSQQKINAFLRKHKFYTWTFTTTVNTI